MSWSYKAGERGVNRVRVAEDPRRGGKLFMEFTVDGKKTRQYFARALTKQEAKRECDQFAAKLRTLPASSRAPQTLAALLALYLEEETPRRRHTPAGIQHSHAAAELFVRAWGADRKPLTVALREWNRFIEDRRSGRLRPPTRVKKNGKASKRVHDGPVRDTQIAHDLKFIMTVFKWATMAGDGAGGVLLERNPCAGFPMPSEASPSRPRMDEARYEAMLTFAPAVHPQFALALILCNETGRRLSSVRQLRWSDVNGQRVLWRGETDKQKRTRETPISPAARAALDTYRRTSRAFADGPIFLDDAGKVARARSTFSKWWKQCERQAGLAPSARMGWHSLRRKFATEMKDAPVADLLHLGGWKSAATLEKCYQEADDATMRSALANRRAITDEKKEEAM